MSVGKLEGRGFHISHCITMGAYSTQIHVNLHREGIEFSYKIEFKKKQRAHLLIWQHDCKSYEETSL